MKFFLAMFFFGLADAAAEFLAATDGGTFFILQVDLGIDMEEGSEEEWCLEILNTDSHLIGPERCSLQTWQLESVNPNAQKPESLQSREIRLKDLNSHDLELFRNSIKKEWDTNVQAGAVAIIEPHEA